MGGRRGRGEVSRRPRLRVADRAAPGVHRSRAAPARGARCPLRPNPRPVRRSRRRRPLRAFRVTRGRGARRPRARRSGRSRRVPPRGCAPRMVRRRDPPPVASSLARRPAPRGRACRSAGAGGVPPGLAGSQRYAARGGGLGGDRRCARRRPDRGVDAGGRRVGSPGRWLPLVDARRAVHRRRRGVARRRSHRIERRPCPGVLRRPDRPAGAGVGTRRLTLRGTARHRP